MHYLATLFVVLFTGVTAMAQTHNSITLPMCNGAANQTATLVWLTTTPHAGDTIKLSDSNYTLLKSNLTFNTLGEMSDAALKGSLISNNVATLLLDASGDKNAQIFLDTELLADKTGTPVKRECSYRLRYK